jgi:hypothetical protein
MTTSNPVPADSSKAPGSTAGRTRRIKALVVALALSGLATLGVVTLAGSTAEAIPYYEKSCAFDLRSNAAQYGWQPVNSYVRVYTGSYARYVVVNFNADAGVVSGAEIRVGYRVDAGSVQTPGAQNFANHTEYWQTRHSMVVLWVPAGWHVIRPYWRISGAYGATGYMHSRCLTSEAYTS